MDAIYLLIPIALILVTIGIVIFLWAVKNDQFEDFKGPAHSILFDDIHEIKTSNKVKKPTSSLSNNENKDTKKPKINE